MTDTIDQREGAAHTDSELQIKVMDTLLHGAFGGLGCQQREHVLHTTTRKLQRLSRAQTNLTLPELAAMARKAELPVTMIVHMAEAGLAPRQVRALAAEAEAISDAVSDLIALSPRERRRILDQIAALRAAPDTPADPYSSSGDDLA